MSREPTWRRYLRFWGEDPAADLEEEIEFHLASRASELAREGLSAKAARQRAEREFGDLAGARRECRAIDEQRLRRVRTAERLGAIIQDLRFAGRTLRRSPGFAAVAVLTLGLGIGAGTAVFSVVNAVLMRSLPYPHAERLTRVYSQWRGDLSTASPPDFADWRARSHSFTGLTAFTDGSFALTGEGDAESVRGAYVTAEFFGVLGVAPQVGRGFTPEEGVPGGDDAVVLSNGLWRGRFGSSPSIIGRRIQLNGNAYRVVGVMPPGFAYPAEAQLWVPLTFSAEALASQRGAHYVSVLGRLRPGISAAAAEREVQQIARRLAEEYPKTDAGYSARVTPMREAMVGSVRRSLLVLLGAVGLFLLIACVNVAGLFLTRASGRDRELAVRTALGASSLRLVRGLLAEGLVLAAAGGVVGLLLAWGATRALVALRPDAIPRVEEIGVDGRVLAFTAAACLGSALIFALLPALRAVRSRDVGEALRGSRGTSASRESGRIRSALVVTQIALAMALLTGAGLLTRSFLQLRRVDPGFDPRGVLTFEVEAPEVRYRNPAAVRQFHRELLERIRSLRGVESAGAVFGLPMSGFSYSISLSWLDGVRLQDDAEHEISTQIRVVEPGYFRTMGIPLRRGRVLDARDREGAAPAVLVDDAAARLLWPGRDPIGHSLVLGTTFGVDTAHAGGRVVGVVANVRDEGLDSDPEPHVYLAHAQYPLSYMTVVARTGGDPMRLMDPARRALKALDPAVPLARPRTMRQWMATTDAERRFDLVLLGVFAASALLLAAVGVYGVLSHTVRQRSRELGIRVALGARGGQVLTMILRRGMGLALLGVAGGLLLSFATARLLGHLLFGVRPSDPLTLLATAALLTAVALVASWLPAHRATRIDPVAALRAD